MKRVLNVGLYASTQSGRAFMADLLPQVTVTGYARPSEHGREFVEAISRSGGIYLLRPPEIVGEESRFVELYPPSTLTHVIETLGNTDVILFSLPSIYHEDFARSLSSAGVTDRRIPIILSPSRTMGSPYLWRVLGEGYPIISLSTCLYSSKAPEPDKVLIKRRKRTMVGSVDAPVDSYIIEALEKLFPQTIFTPYPGTTSLGNIGAVFHPGGYVYNWDDIQRYGDRFSYYMDGIAAKPEVGEKLEEIDQTRLSIAKAIGMDVFGYHEDPREYEWQQIMEELRAMEKELQGAEMYDLRQLRSRHLHEIISHAVVSARCWLDYTYGVELRPGESLSEAIRRTPTYQRSSVPQERYVKEDIPTGLVPIEAMAKRFGVDHERVTEVIDLYEERIGRDLRAEGRNLEGFSDEYIFSYLTGTLYK
jgi:hypothetical protein